MEHSAAGGRIHRVEEAIVLKGTWTGPAAPELHPRALAPVASLPVLEVVSAAHILADLTLRLGKAVHDYLGTCRSWTGSASIDLAQITLFRLRDL